LGRYLLEGPVTAALEGVVVGKSIDHHIDGFSHWLQIHVAIL
jgi:hypothetical protein